MGSHHHPIAAAAGPELRSAPAAAPRGRAEGRPRLRVSSAGFIHAVDAPIAVIWAGRCEEKRWCLLLQLGVSLSGNNNKKAMERREVPLKSDRRGGQEMPPWARRVPLLRAPPARRSRGCVPTPFLTKDSGFCLWMFVSRLVLQEGFYLRICPYNTRFV